MKNRTVARENEALQERIATLHAAILKCNASLDLDTVLPEVLDCARRLTGARFGVIVAVENQMPVDIIFSGLTAEQEREVLATPDGMRLFGHLRQLPAPTRLTDFPGFVAELGLEVPWIFNRTYLGTPLNHLDEDVGHFFLADKADDEAFADEDEEVLTLFASQAASAIANARTHRAERRARADLEALVDTSPVGVLVFDAQSGQPRSLNREARRIVEQLRTPGQPAEQLLEVLSFRRADGREVALSEIPVALQLGSAEAVRAEEMVLWVADGRSVRTLVNATPNHAEDGTVESVVVTLQDLAPLDEIERMRSEFLGLVSHELREPLTAIKGSAATLLEDTRLARAEMHEFHRIIAAQAEHMRVLIGDLLDAGRIDAGTLSVAPEPTEIAELVEEARSTFLGGGGRHGIVVDLPLGLPRAMADPRRIVQVLTNLLANAARHSPESTPIRIAAAHEGTDVAVSVRDEGQGVVPERLPQLFNRHQPGAAGHGLGLSICKGLVEAHGGRIRADSAGPFRGTTVTFTIPAAGELRNESVTGPPPAATEPGALSRILVVDDDPHTLRSVRNTLSVAGYAPVVTGDPEQVAHLIRIEQPELVLLDLMLPGTDGIELMGTVAELSDVPVIFISGYGREETVAKALAAGAADYLVKPFAPTELMARVRGALHRHREPVPFTLGELAIDYGRRRVTVAGSAIDLTRTEYELLRVLSLDAGRVVTYDTLLRRVWSGRSSADPKLVAVFIKDLRRKLGEDASNPTWIFNERGVGYRLAAP